MEIVSTRTNSAVFIPESIVESLTKTENDIVSLSIPSDYNPRNRDNGDLITLAQKISQTVNIRLGLRAKDSKEEEIQLLTLENDLNKFPLLTSNEILKALDMGIDGEFNGDGNIFFNSSQFVKWVKAYIDFTKKPIMAKYLQLKHQVKDPEIIPTEEELREMTSRTVNMYANQRRKDESHRAIGAGSLYETLERLKIYEMPKEEKLSIYNELSRMYSDLPAGELKALCQTAAYNRFISELVDFEMMLDEECKIVDIPEL